MTIPNPLLWDFDIDELLNPYLPAPRLHKLPYWFARFLGYRRTTEKDTFSTRDHRASTIVFWAFIGEFVSLLIIEAIFLNIGGELEERDVPYIFPAFSASAILLFNAIDSPLGQPRSFLLGHFFCAIIGVGILELFALSPRADEIYWISGALACSIATAFMRFTNTIHPPAGATALLPSVNTRVRGLGWWYVPAVMLMSAVMLVTALLVSNIQRKYPEYWWTPLPLGKIPKEEDVEAGRSLRKRITGRRRRDIQGREGGEDESWDEKPASLREDSSKESKDTLVDDDDDMMAVDGKGKGRMKEDMVVISYKGVHVPKWMEPRLGVNETKVLDQLHAEILQRCRENAELVGDADEDGLSPAEMRQRTHHKEH